MLSLSNMNQAQAATYHAKDNYYTSEQGRVYGALAEQLGFSQGQAITHEQFQALIAGFHPITGEKLVDIRQRAGTDAVLSDPKSVSLASEVATGAQKEALQRARERAAAVTREHIQSMAQARVQSENGREAINTQKLLFIEFQHDTSRALDPDFHSHNFIVNMTQTPGGEWKALHNDYIARNEYYLGMIYRSELAKSLQDEGFAITITDERQGFFELKGMESKELITHYSKRREQIEAIQEKLANGNELSKEQKELAKLADRAYKKHLSEEENAQAHALVREELKDKFNITAETIQALQQAPIQHNKLTATQALDLAISATQETEANFAREEIQHTALKLGLSHGITIDEISQAWEEKGFLQTEKTDGKLRPMFTTREMVEAEQSLLNIALTTRDTKESLVLNAHEQITTYTQANNIKLTQGQQDALAHILTSTDQVSCIQGDAGTGKTFAVATAKNIALANNENIEFIGLAPTGKAADGLQADSGIASQTIASFIRKEAEQTGKERIYIVDESGMVGTKQMLALLQKAQLENARVVLIGDKKQFKAVEAGDSFGTLQNKLKEAGSTIAEMHEVLRQKNADLINAVSAMKRQNTQEALSYIASSTHENAFWDEQKHEIAQDYLASANAIIVASTNAQARELNYIIRDELVRAGKLAEGTTQEILISKNIAGIAKHQMASYAVGDIMEFSRGVGFKGGEKLEIEAIKDGKLIFRGGKELDLTQKFQASLFERSQASFATNDKIIFLANEKKLGVKNGTIAEIVDVQADKISVKLDGKTQITFSTQEFQKFSHAYAVTDYKSQGMTVDKVIIAARAKLASYNAFYVQLTRAKHQASLYTDDLKTFSKRIQTAQEKSKALDNQTKQQGASHESGVINTSRWSHLIDSARSATRAFTVALTSAITDYRDSYHRAKRESELERDFTVHRRAAQSHIERIAKSLRSAITLLREEYKLNTQHTQQQQKGDEYMNNSRFDFEEKALRIEDQESKWHSWSSLAEVAEAETIKELRSRADHELSGREYREAVERINLVRDLIEAKQNPKEHNSIEHAYQALKDLREQTKTANFGREI